MQNEQKIRDYLYVSIFLIITCIAFLFAVCGLAIAAEKNWDAGGDASSWSDGDNWHAAGIPTSADDVVIDREDAAVICARTFKAKSITIGGQETSTLTSENFIYGTVAPDTTSEVAILNRAGGTITLKGAGVLILKGKYKDSEGALAAEPSFIFWVE